MNVGMMWYDSSAKSVEKKITEGAEYYEKKYGRKPNSCVVNPEDFDKSISVDGITITQQKYILKNIFWIGVSNG